MTAGDVVRDAVRDLVADADPVRIGKGRRYARDGRVALGDVVPGELQATVVGSRSEPYRVVLRCRDAPGELGDALVHLASGGADPGRPHVDAAVLDLAVEEDLAVVPGSVTASCSCPDWEDLCKHAVAVVWTFAQEVRDDPGLLLDWRGIELPAADDTGRTRGPGDAAASTGPGGAAGTRPGGTTGTGPGGAAGAARVVRAFPGPGGAGSADPAGAEPAGADPAGRDRSGAEPSTTGDRARQIEELRALVARSAPAAPWRETSTGSVLRLVGEAVEEAVPLDPFFVGAMPQSGSPLADLPPLSARPAAFRPGVTVLDNVDIGAVLADAMAALAEILQSDD